MYGKLSRQNTAEPFHCGPFCQAVVISKHNFSNICTRVKSPVPSVMLSLSPSPFGNWDWPSDVMQDFIGLSLANTTRSWCALWFTLHRSFANMKVHFQPDARRAYWAFMLNPRDTTTKHTSFIITCKIAHTTLKLL